MRRPIRGRGRRAGLALLAILTITAAWPAGAARAADEVVTAGSAWDGSVDLYRDGVFATQATWQWCTAAGVQIIRNIVEDDDDHSRAAQGRYFAWMRSKNRYDLPVAAGVDPEGWAAGLRRFVDERYRVVASRTFEAALRSAARNLRVTGLPVALTVANGGHGWILTGFSATADPGETDAFTVTSVRVVGPLFGRQSRGGYDMAPNTSLSAAELRRFLTRWRYVPKPMVWDGRYVTVQPVVAEIAVPAPIPAVPGRLADTAARGMLALEAPRLATFAIAGPSVR